ncbi:unnamed protein product [Meganyctiphanes norvegica]|uniref:Uncharacterized protein n=1 Tax=Meganyctiphanes norvegica TaxID=48144 RepID=A0AAV2Q576_MEGNR
MAEADNGNTKINLEVDEKDKVFEGGHVIKGTMRVTVAKDTKCNEVFATAKGKGETLWAANQKGNFMNQEYFNKTVSFWLGSEHDNMLKKGDYSYPFHFILPDDIPSSFEGEHGWITYKVKGKVDSLSCEVKLKVMETHDLNKDLQAKKPIQLQEEATACCCCCKQGPLSYTITAEKRGFVPGEEIVLFGEIDNKASRAIERIKIKILQKTTFRSQQGREKENTKSIQEVVLNGISANSTEFCSVDFII